MPKTIDDVYIQRKVVEYIAAVLVIVIRILIQDPNDVSDCFAFRFGFGLAMAMMVTIMASPLVDKFQLTKKKTKSELKSSH